MNKKWAWTHTFWSCNPKLDHLSHCHCSIKQLRKLTLNFCRCYSRNWGSYSLGPGQEGSQGHHSGPRHQQGRKSRQENQVQDMLLALIVGANVSRHFFCWMGFVSTGSKPRVGFFWRDSNLCTTPSTDKCSDCRSRVKNSNLLLVN